MKLLYLTLVASLFALAFLAFAAFFGPARAQGGPLVPAPGWNLVGGVDMTPEDYFAGHPECIEMDIYGWEGLTQTWTHWFSYVPDYVNDPRFGGIAFMNYEKGFYVRCHQAGQVASFSQSLHLGTPAPRVTEAAWLVVGEDSPPYEVVTPAPTLTPTPNWVFIPPPE